MISDKCKQNGWGLLGDNSHLAGGHTWAGSRGPPSLQVICHLRAGQGWARQYRAHGRQTGEPASPYKVGHLPPCKPAGVSEASMTQSSSSSGTSGGARMEGWEGHSCPCWLQPVAGLKVIPLSEKWAHVIVFPSSPPWMSKVKRFLFPSSEAENGVEEKKKVCRSPGALSPTPSSEAESQDQKRTISLRWVLTWLPLFFFFFFLAFQREGLLERAGISSFMVVAKTKALLQAGNTPEREVRCFSFTSRHWHLLSLWALPSSLSSPSHPSLLQTFCPFLKHWFCYVIKPGWHRVRKHLERLAALLMRPPRLNCVLSLWVCTAAVSLPWQLQKWEEGKSLARDPWAGCALPVSGGQCWKPGSVWSWDCEERGGLRHGLLLPITLRGTNYVLFFTWKKEVGISSCFSALKGEWLSQRSITSNSGRSSTPSGVIALFPLLELSELLPSTTLGLC